MLSANQSLTDKYLQGVLNKDDDVPDAWNPWAVEGEPTLADDQQRYANEIIQNVEEGMALLQKRDERWRGEPKDNSPFEPAAPRRPAFAILGPAGSGKTILVQHAIRRVHEKGGRTDDGFEI